MERSCLIEVFQWLHRHPELAMEERKTTAFIRNILAENGVRLLETGLETGVIAALGKGEGPTVALRADIDGLPVCEQTGLAYASGRPGVMHACGHDFHAACMLGAALLLKAREAELPGTVKVIFQPAEEVNRGAALMVATGRAAGRRAAVSRRAHLPLVRGGHPGRAARTDDGIRRPLFGEAYRQGLSCRQSRTGHRSGSRAGGHRYRGAEHRQPTGESLR